MKHVIQSFFFPVLLIAALCLSLVTPLLVPSVAEAHFEEFDQAMISITFDDGYASTYEAALPILNRYNLTATTYVTTDYIGQPDFMTWEEVRRMQNNYQWEIGSHTVSHPELPLLTDSQIAYELRESKVILDRNGLQVSSFASPFGAYDNRVVTEAMKHYRSHRGFWDRDGLNAYPYNRQVIQVQSIEDSTSVEQVIQWVNQAKSENKWLVLVLHEVQRSHDPNYAYTTTIRDLDRIARYIAASGLKVATMSQALERTHQNLLPLGGFDQGLTKGWSTDSATQVTQTSDGQGAFPTSQTAVKMRGGDTAAHLFSPHVPAVFGSTYLFEGVVNASLLTTGEAGIYIDEFDTVGNWVSGQWKGMTPVGQSKLFSISYQPTSSDVASFSIQTYLSAGSVGEVNVDQYELYNLTTSNSSAQPSPIPHSKTNLVANPGFESVVDGWASEWSRDNDQTSVAPAPQDDQGEYSLRVGPTASRGAHAFSSKIAVSPDRQYQWHQFIASSHNAGEFGFYIDEYDAAGNWISGQWKGLVEFGYVGNMSWDYSPTSNRVAFVALQYYATPQMTGMVSVDSVQFFDIHEDNASDEQSQEAMPDSTSAPTIASPTPTSWPQSQQSDWLATILSYWNK